MRSARRAALAALAAAVLLRPAAAGAHDFEPGVLSLVEVAEGRFRLAWTPPVDSAGETAQVGFSLPAGCRRTADLVACGGGGLAGPITFTGLDGRRSKVVVLVRWLDGAGSEELVSGDRPRVLLARRPARRLVPWIRLGVEHILTGADHLAFLLGMLLVLGLAASRRLVATITAFTLAHSLSLALAALGLVRLPAAPVEAAIAASVVLVAREVIVVRPTATRRWPWLVAGLFGLVHGLGFAGALGEIGLPRGALGVSLLGFNLGVELGQLAVVAAAILLARLLPLGATAGSVGDRDRGAGRAQRGMAYVLGALGAAWFLARAAELLSA